MSPDTWGSGTGRRAPKTSRGEDEMRRKIALGLAAMTVFLAVPSVAATSPFYGDSTGKARKACEQSGGTWTPYFQTCTYE